VDRTKCVDTVRPGLGHGRTAHSRRQLCPKIDVCLLLSPLPMTAEVTPAARKRKTAWLGGGWYVLSVSVHAETLLLCWRGHCARGLLGPKLYLSPGPAPGPFGPTQPEPEVYIQISYPTWKKARLPFIPARINPHLFKICPDYGVVNIVTYSGSSIHDGSLLHSQFNTQLLITVHSFSRFLTHV
jgi:hypothetical protein